MKKKLSLGISKMSFEQSEDRTNWMTFKGTCMYVDRPSDYTPSGGNKPTLFPRAVVEAALPTMVDMGVNCMYEDWYTDALFEGHDSQFKIGVVKTIEIQGDEVVITGGLWSYDFADLCDKIKSAKKSLGWSIEVLLNLSDQEEYNEASDVEFVGVALLWADKAAFSDTYMFAQRKDKGGIQMDKEELQKLLAEFFAGINKVISDNIEGVKAEFSAQIDVVAKATTEGFAKIEAEKQALALAAEEAQKKAEAEAAEKEKLALEAQKKAEEDATKAKAELEAQRNTLQFGVHVGKFEGDNEAQKAILENSKLTPAEQFRKLIDLKLQQAK